MNYNLSDYDIDSLKALYEKENEVLQTRLLSGEAWEEVKDQRQKVTEISIALHKKFTALHSLNPAEFPSNDMEGRS
jgi:hypothetical protein